MTAGTSGLATIADVLQAKTALAQSQLVAQSAEGNVQADSTQIHQIVINLCHNAVHAMGGHSGRIDVAMPCE